MKLEIDDSTEMDAFALQVTMVASVRITIRAGIIRVRIRPTALSCLTRVNTIVSVQSASEVRLAILFRFDFMLVV